MRFRLITAGEAERFDEFISASADGHIFQSYMWGEVKKPAWQPLRVVLEKEGQPVAAASILKRNIPLTQRSIFYLPRGPVLKDWDDAAAVEELFSGIITLAGEHGAVLIKIDPCLLERRRDPIAALRRIGFRSAPGKHDFGGLQPRYTFCLDLEGDLGQIMRRLPKKVRYKIRYGSARGLEFCSAGEEALPEFIHLLEKTAGRRGFVGRKPDYYRRLFRILGPAGAIELTLGHLKDEVLVAGITIVFGEKAWAVYGGQSDKHRNLYAYHALIWERIKWARSRGARWFDFYGVPGEVDETHPLYGIYHFKKSFGGDYCAFIGEQDLVLSRGYYWIWRRIFPLFYDSAMWMVKTGRRIASGPFF